ncbi:carcinoembryonic antigen-related cell adhesion molecule 21-like [Parambassis ranga]|uniref:Carcinoembryonic antigen-related cell adhesion molecule 21-like n=1 Tax=Parambassis ranga TaxID=210632 RepID=A0A6P7JPD0_9TELE|nr:carcinoembryonic antigen-related cell adhesion molecule 21-like [Parambassis ranga]XP_028278779.1 carcinoembryonic antigen-related cell adhesion molecule 21-like [Parambassis ranga]XP_028278780.1 carcinoembryonic antigen-related cell adhesion molecule 21-like [Parambassis ranga]XP_028278781.1 carcinoembryonic antigen-related cell adhesion molecule 21-like [Parambassis ranga]
MERRVGVLLLLLAVINCAAADTIVSYFGSGGELVLRPHGIPDRINEIVWKHRGNLLAEWTDGDTHPTYYGVFVKGVVLNPSTGELKISNMDETYTGVYVVQLNLNVQEDHYEATMIKKVPEPEVHPQPLACGPHLDNCALTCEGDITDAGPVIYYWMMEPKGWTKSEKVKNIINDEKTQRVETFSCKIENPISAEKSEPLKNPFFTETTETTNNVTVIAIVSVLVPALVLSVVLYVFRVRIMRFCGRQDSSRSANPANGSSPGKEGENVALRGHTTP